MSGFGAGSFGSLAFGASPAVGGLLIEHMTTEADAFDGLDLATPYRTLVSAVLASDALTFRDIANLADIALASDDPSTAAHLYTALADIANASDVISQVITAVLADSASAAEAYTMIYARFEHLRDFAVATDDTLTSLSAGAALLSTAVAMELMSRGYDVDLLDQASGSDVLAESIRGVALLLDQAQASAALVDTLRAVVLLHDSAAADDDLTSTGRFYSLLESGADAALIIRIGGVEYTAWVMNADNMATSQYQNFGFNSFAETVRGTYGAREDGLYLLEGDTDNGVHIQAWIRSGLTNFGTGSLKSVPMMYIGLTADGDMLLTVAVTTPEGAKTEYTYRMTERTANATRENRVKIGKGLRSVYWQWELRNTGGSNFSVDTTRLWPLVLSRRIR